MSLRLSTFALWAAMTTAFWLTVNDSLTAMTRHDCQAGIQRACLSVGERP